MFKIKNYSVVTLAVDDIVLFSSAMMEKLDSIGRAADGIIKVASALEMEMDDEARVNSIAHLMDLVKHGLNMNGIHYVPFFAGSSDIRNGASAWIDVDIHAMIGKWAMCGLQTKDLNIAVNKYAAYIGLLMSSTRKFKDVYGNALDIRRVCVVKDVFVEVADTVDFISNGTLNTGLQETVKVNAFDGASYIRPECTGGRCSTLRAPWVKALAVPVDFLGFAKEHGLSTIIKDYWGNDVDLDDIDLILTESCFKMAGQYKDFDQYQTAFEELGHEIRVCVEEHAPRKKAMPYQQLQTLVGGDQQDAMKLACMTKEHFDKFSDPHETGALIGGNLGRAAKLWPDLLVEPYTACQLEEAYTAKRNRALGGKVFDLGYNAFLAPDPVAMLEALFGLPVKGVLKAGECFCKNAGRGWVDVTRNPHLDHAHVILYAVRKPSDYFMGPTMYLSIWDMTTIRLRADYDGDHVWYSRNAFLLNAVRKTDRILRNLPVDWVAPKAPKSAINKATLAQFFTGLTQTSQIGIYADNFTKFWAWMTEEIREDRVSVEEARKAWTWLTWAGNVLIDAAKHGSANVKPPEIVRYFSKMPLPAFCEYAKADSNRPVGGEHWASRVSKTEGFGDMYMKCIQDNIPEKLHVDGENGLVFNVSTMMFDARRPGAGMAGLWGQGVYSAQNGTYMETGLFQQLAFMHAQELEALRDSGCDQEHRRSWEAERGAIALQQIKNWAEERGCTIEAAYDVVTRQVFCARYSSIGMEHVIKRAYWSIFGEMAMSAIAGNLNQDVFDAELPEIEDVDLE